MATYNQQPRPTGIESFGHSTTTSALLIAIAMVLGHCFDAKARMYVACMETAEAINECTKVGP